MDEDGDGILSEEEKKARVEWIDSRLKEAEKEYLAEITKAIGEREEEKVAARKAEEQKERDAWKAVRAKQKRDHIQGKPPMDDEACILMVQSMIAVEPLPEREQFNQDMNSSLEISSHDPEVLMLYDELKSLREERKELTGCTPPKWTPRKEEGGEEVEGKSEGKQ